MELESIFVFFQATTSKNFFLLSTVTVASFFLSFLFILFDSVNFRLLSRKIMGNKALERWDKRCVWRNKCMSFLLLLCFHASTALRILSPLESIFLFYFLISHPFRKLRYIFQYLLNRSHWLRNMPINSNKMASK